MEIDAGRLLTQLRRKGLLPFLSPGIVIARAAQLENGGRHCRGAVFAVRGDLEMVVTQKQKQICGRGNQVSGRLQSWC